MSEDKKKRSTNFTKSQIDLLCKLVIKHSNVIESKVSNAYTWKEKLQEWNLLTAEFNARNVGAPRAMLSLKTKYESFKNDLRKKVAANKQELFKTGGGVPYFKPLTSSEELIHNLIHLSTVGLKARYDDDSASILSDNDEGNKERERANNMNENYEQENSEQNNYDQENIQQENIDQSFAVFDMIFEPFPQSEDVIEICDEQQIEDRNCTLSENSRDHSLHFPSSTEHNYGKKNKTEQVQKKKENFVQTLATKEVVKNKESPAQTSGTKWNPQKLKQPLSSNLQVRRKYLLTNLQASQKVTLLSAAKKDLIKLRKQQLKEEMEFLEKERKIKLESAEQELQRIKLEVNIKNIEKQIKQEIKF